MTLAKVLQILSRVHLTVYLRASATTACIGRSPRGHPPSARDRFALPSQRARSSCAGLGAIASEDGPLLIAVGTVVQFHRAEELECVAEVATYDRVVELREGGAAMGGPCVIGDSSRSSLYVQVRRNSRGLPHRHDTRALTTGNLR